MASKYKNVLLILVKTDLKTHALSKNSNFEITNS